MIRNRTSLAIAAALAASLSLAACKKAEAPVEPTPAPAPAPAAEAPAPAPAPTTPAAPAAPTVFTVTGVDLGNAVGADNKVTAPSTTFAKGDTIHASVLTDGPTGSDIVAKWTYQDGQKVNEGTKTVPAGPQVTDFSISNPKGAWPLGKYRVEISVNGAVVQTREFEIK